MKSYRQFLVLEDDLQLRGVIVSFLGRFLPWWGSICVSHPRQAKQHIHENPSIGLLVAGLELQGHEETGLDVIRWVCEHHRDVACILTTGGGEIDMSSVPEGVPVLLQPFTGAQLIIAVREGWGNLS